MKELELSVQDIKELMETFSRGDFGSFELAKGDFHLKLEGKKIEQVMVPAGAAAVTAVPVHALAGAASLAVKAEEPACRGNVVKSPIVGTFYAAPSPEQSPYVQVGDKVQKGDVLFIIESMKLMNEVTSEYDGTVAQILVENAQGVEYGQPILTID